MNNTVLCAICNKPFKSITYRHLKHHNITLDEYKIKYPAAPLQSEKSIQIKKDSATQANKSRKGKPRSQQTKDKIKQTKKDNPKPAWNKGIQLSLKQKKILSNIKIEGYKTGKYVHWNVGNATSQDTKNKISCTSKSQYGKQYTEKSLNKRNDTIQIKKANGWIHHSTLRKGTPLNLSESSREKIKSSSRITNAKKHNVSIQRIQEHLNKFNVTLIGVDDSFYVYTLLCSKCNTEFTRTKSMLVPYKYETINGKYCPTCFPSQIGYYTEEFFTSNPELKNINGYFYFIELIGKTETFLKVGITRNAFDTRMRNINDYTITPLIIIPMNLYDAFVLEQQTLSLLEFRYKPSIQFGGYTECFMVDHYDDILNHITNNIPEQYIVEQEG